MLPIVTVQLTHEIDVATTRRRARQIAELLGFGDMDRMEIASAVAEIAQNAASHGGGGHVEFALDTASPAILVMTVIDDGPGIAGLDAMRAEQFEKAAGLRGARLLSDRFDVQAGAAGTRVLLARTLPPGHRVEPADLVAAARRLANDDHVELLDEIRLQSHELLRSLGALKGRQAESPPQNEEMAANAELTGSIAHDFNNALQIVTSNLEILGRGLPVDDRRLHRATDNAMQGAQRAVALTRRLLDLSRR